MVDQAILNDELTEPNISSKSKLINIRLKILIASVFSISFFLYRCLYKKYNSQSCNVDKYHQFTYQANRKLYHGWDNTMIGIGQLLMDGWVLFMGIFWFMKVKNMRFPSAAAVFFLFRAILLNMEKFPFPEDIVWHNPGFFSITVPYDHTRDFFYSGHTGSLSIISLQLWTLNKKKICAVCIVSLIYMVNMLTITRIHYSIDIIGGLIFALFWYKGVVQKFLPKFDYFFSGFFYIGRFLLNKFKRKNQSNQNSQVQMKGNPQSMSNNKKMLDKSEQNKSQKYNQKQIQNGVNMNMNDQITQCQDFPYLNQFSQKDK